MEQESKQSGRGRKRFPTRREGRQSNSRSKRQGKKRINLQQLLKVCSSKGSCLEWMQNQGFIPKVMFCPNCRKKMNFELQEVLRDGYLWICREEDCKQNPPAFSPRQFSWFETKDISLVDILLFSYFWSAELSKDLIIHEMNMSEKDYQEWNLLFSQICETSERLSLGQAIDSDKTVLSGVEATSTRSHYVAMWRQRNRSSDPFMELLRSADTVYDEYLSKSTNTQVP